MPESWKDRSIDSCDEDFIKSRIVCQKIMDGLGSDYMSVYAWLKDLKTLNVSYGHFVTRYEVELASHYKVVDDVLTIVAVMLSYNTLYFKFPKLDAEKRGQNLKDVRRKIKAKLGNTFDIPHKISDRLQAAISGK